MCMLWSINLVFILDLLHGTVMISTVIYLWGFWAPATLKI